MMRLLWLILLPTLVSFSAETIRQPGYEFWFDGFGAGRIVQGTTKIELPELWAIAIGDQPSVSASAFVKEPWNAQVEVKREGNALIATYIAKACVLEFVADCKPQEIDFTFNVTSTDREINRVVLPAKSHFPLEGMGKVIFPQYGSETNGIAFLPDYFRRHTGNTKLVSQRVGPEPYATFSGLELNYLPFKEPEKPLEVTAEGKQWFSDEAVKAIEGASMRVCRPPKEGHKDLVLVRNASGDLIHGNQYGGKGWFFRNSTGGFGRNPIAGTLMLETLAGLARQNPELLKDKRFAVISLPLFKENMSWAALRVGEWSALLNTSKLVSQMRGQVVMIRTPEELKSALQDNKFGLILNPYNEWLATGTIEQHQSYVAAIKDFVIRGGVWWETGGVPFYFSAAYQEYCSYHTLYPAAVADFAQFQFASGNVSIFGIQPMLRRPWDRERYCTPVTLSITGTGTSADYVHSWHFYIDQGGTWRSPKFRWQFNHSSAQAALDEYGMINEINVPLSAKEVKQGTLSRLKEAMLLRYRVGNAKRQISELDHIPPSSNLHFTEYLKGGFDKQYPDHLPPNKNWGTEDDMKEFVRIAHERGHLSMPYTNTSWWGSTPKGPTFIAAGEAPLAKAKDGKALTETYGNNQGYSLSFHHPAVQQAHRKVRRQMAQTMQHDILLQDQVGSRGWRVDFNPVEPIKGPNAMDGLVSLSMEDMEEVMLACEDGYDRVLNIETIICGSSWGQVPGDGVNRTRHNKHHFPKGEWQFFPILGFLGHDKCLFTNHDLDLYIIDHERMAAILAFGYATSETWQAGLQNTPKKRDWVFWVDAVQKTACADYAGRKMLDFIYLQEHTAAPAPHMLIYTRFDGDISVLTNTGKAPITLNGLLERTKLPDGDKSWLEGQVMPGFGYYVCSPRVRTGHLYASDGKATCFAFRKKEGRLLGGLRGESGTVLRIPVPNDWTSQALRLQALGFQNQETQCRIESGWMTVAIPVKDRDIKKLPAELKVKSPAALGILKPEVVIYNPQPCKDGYQNGRASDFKSEFARHFARTDLKTIEVTDVHKMLSMLRLPYGASGRPFAVINPLTEIMPGVEGVEFDEIAKAVHDYVVNGGIWWETGGAPFFYYRKLKEDGTHTQTALGFSGLARFGLMTQGVGHDNPAEHLNVTEIGEQWFGPERTRRFRASYSNMSRSFESDPNSVVLIQCDAGASDFVAPNRLGGWGFFGNIGGFRVPGNLAPDIVAGALIYLWNNPWPEPSHDGYEVLWRF